MGAVELSSLVMAASPLVYYKFEEASGNPQDSSGNGLHITTTNGAPLYRQSGLSDAPAIFCDGVDDLFRRAAFGTAVDNLTAVTWVYPQTFGGWVMAMDNSQSSGWYISLLGSNLGRVRVSVNGVAQSASSAGLERFRWNHIAVVRRATVWEYYINGELDTANAGTTTPNTNAGTAEFFNTTLVVRQLHLAIFESALSPGSIRAQYQAMLPTWLGPRGVAGVA